METGAESHRQIQEQTGRGKAGEREKAEAKAGRQEQDRDRHTKYLGCGPVSGSEPLQP